MDFLEWEGAANVASPPTSPSAPHSQEVHPPPKWGRLSFLQRASLSSPFVSLPSPVYLLLSALQYLVGSILTDVRVFALSFHSLVGEFGDIIRCNIAESPFLKGHGPALFRFDSFRQFPAEPFLVLAASLRFVLTS